MKKSDFQTIVKNPIQRATRYQEMVGTYFDLVTDSYRQHWGESFHFAIFSSSEPLKDALNNTERFIADSGQFCSGMKILDVGCGVAGPAINIAAYSGAHVTGININAQQLEIANRRVKEHGLSDKIELVLADAMQMPFENESFDAVYIFEAGCHMPNKANFYQECALVLRPGGVFVGTDWFTAEDLTTEQKTKYIEPICRYHAVPNIISLGDLKKCLVSAGLTVEVVENIENHGNILRNWELMDTRIAQNIRGLIPWLLPSTLKMLTKGGYALLDGVKSGTFMIGHWRARKPV
ncbi:cyclopropane-fatty-acyl-phospholipid synthase family protein [Calothrix sp. NIES-4071]|nr:cyclopropane-fatty-acyl-phospholipid synthase family protein [Calothrix sp. NIES-4071]BAZ57898.1 cyclopropane-fatty-acyl-phospholipid synthase family protein [Calothrix sp. NIES-4105]